MLRAHVSWMAIAALAITLLLAGSAWAQRTEEVIYTFPDEQQGEFPNSLVSYAPDALYGTTVQGGPYEVGTLFDLGTVSGSENVIYWFGSIGTQSDYPGGLVLDSAGNLYGVAENGLLPNDNPAYGVIWKLPGVISGDVVYAFSGGADGADPSIGFIDSAGNIYGTTNRGGNTTSPYCLSLGSGTLPGCGTVFKVDLSGNLTVLYTFTGGSDGGVPVGGLTADSSGNLYGATYYGGDIASSVCVPYGGWRGCGVVFELTPSGNGAWTEVVLYTFAGGSDGAQPQASPVFDFAGNLYGTTTFGGDNANTNCRYGTATGCGVVYKLTPTTSGNWTEAVLHAFSGGTDGMRPSIGAILDSAGNLYGTAIDTAYELTPTLAGPWTHTLLYTFCSQTNCTDGDIPFSNVILDSAGNLYGGTDKGGSATCNCGVIYELLAPSGPPPTTTTVTSSLNPSSTGQSVMFTAAVTPATGPTGTVAFSADGTTILSGCAAVPLASGTASCSTSSLANGIHSIMAIYSGDSNYGSSAGGVLQTVESSISPTNTTVVSNENPSQSGQAVTFAATVTPSGGPSGSVAFTADGSGLAGCGAVALASGSAQCSTSALAVGSHNIVATYSGDSSYSGSTGSMTQVVQAAPVGTFTLTVAPPSEEVRAGDTATYTVTVTSRDGFSGPVSLSCAGQPADAGYNFDPVTVTVPAGGSAQSTLTIQTTTRDGSPIQAAKIYGLRFTNDDFHGERQPADGQSVAGDQRSGVRWAFFLFLPALALTGRRARASRLVRCLLALLLLALLLGMGGCGGHHQVYTITITGTANANPPVTQSAAVSLVVD
jgi:uncharacterized repeat protein (TIGR03803 family)